LLGIQNEDEMSKSASDLVRKNSHTHKKMGSMHHNLNRSH